MKFTFFLFSLLSQVPWILALSNKYINWSLLKSYFISRGTSILWHTEQISCLLGIWHLYSLIPEWLNQTLSLTGFKWPREPSVWIRNNKIIYCSRSETFSNGIYLEAEKVVKLSCMKSCHPCRISFIGSWIYVF